MERLNFMFNLSDQNKFMQTKDYNWIRLIKFRTFVMYTWYQAVRNDNKTALINVETWNITMAILNPRTLLLIFQEHAAPEEI